jgi:hypothetical protein
VANKKFLPNAIVNGTTCSHLALVLQPHAVILCGVAA